MKFSFSSKIIDQTKMLHFIAINFGKGEEWWVIFFITMDKVCIVDDDGIKSDRVERGFISWLLMQSVYYMYNVVCPGHYMIHLNCITMHLWGTQLMCCIIQVYSLFIGWKSLESFTAFSTYTHFSVPDNTIRTKMEFVEICSFWVWIMNLSCTFVTVI